MTEERRCYETGQCPYHNILQKQVNSALPRWVFVSAFGTMITLALLFAGWQASSIAAFDIKYNENVKEFNAIARQNKELLVELRTNFANQEKMIKRLTDQLELERNRK